MNTTGRTIAVLAAVLTIGVTSAVAADNLGTILRESGWDRMIGTWADAETKGKKHKSVNAWRFKDHVIECSNEDLQLGKKEAGFIAHSAKKGDVFYVSADDKGGSTIGKWTFSNDEAVLDLGFVTADKQEGLLQLRYTFADDDTMIVTLVLPEPIVIRMIRVKE